MYKSFSVLFEAGTSEQYDRFSLREALERLGVSEIHLMARDETGLTTPIYSHDTPNICRKAKVRILSYN